MKRKYKLFTGIILASICFLLLLFYFINTNKIITLNSFFNNSNISFNKSLGDIYIPTKTDYLLSLFFKSDSKQEVELEHTTTKDTLITFNNPNIQIVDYSVEKDYSIKNGYALNLIIRVDNNEQNKINNIYINNKKYEIGEIAITTNENSHFLIKSNVAAGSSFEKYFADFINQTNTNINIHDLSCGSLDVTTPMYEISTPQQTYLENFIINRNEVSTITVYFDKNKLKNTLETIYVSPRFSYMLNGKTFIYYFPYSVYKL